MLNLSDRILCKPKPWNQLGKKAREHYIRVHLFLNDPFRFEKLNDWKEKNFSKFCCGWSVDKILFLFKDDKKWKPKKQRVVWKPNCSVNGDNPHLLESTSSDVSVKNNNSTIEVTNEIDSQQVARQQESSMENNLKSEY